MKRTARKRELYDLVRDLHAHGLTEPSLIALALRITPQRVSQIVADLGLRKPRQRLADALTQLPSDLRIRLVSFVHFRDENDSSTPPRKRGVTCRAS